MSGSATKSEKSCLSTLLINMMIQPLKEHLEKTTAEQDHVEQQVIADRSLKSMNFVQSVPEEYERSERQRDREKNKDFVHSPPIHNNTSVTVTDDKGNKKTGAPAGRLEEIKGGSRRSTKYAAEATAEHVGRSAKNLGMKSVVVEVKGSTYSGKKKAVIPSPRKGVGRKSLIMHIHDVTQLSHNGCRLPRKRRVQ
uniref:Ribosomal protein S11 n=1 Tax=Ceratozamia hildae TaxID=171009 RepID=A0A6M3X331_CERHI|nr:ribosomal protein S11 [Ceratozamia hildae]